MRWSMLLIPCFAMILGCKADGDILDPNASYVLKVASKKQGDRYDIQQINALDLLANGWDTKGLLNLDATKVWNNRLWFQEVIQEFPANEERPTKIRRTYSRAENLDSKANVEPMAFSGKSLWANYQDGRYNYVLEGGHEVRIGGGSVEFEDQFDGPKSPPPFQDYLPRDAVKVNQTWEISSTVLRKFTRPMEQAIDLAKSKGEGRLLRVYSKGGRPWGEIEIKLELKPKFSKHPEIIEGTMTYTQKYDVPIDGSSYEGTMVLMADFVFESPTKDAKLRLSERREQVVKPAK